MEMADYTTGCSSAFRDRVAVREAEAAHADLEQRLTTFHERERDGGEPFLELLAADTLSRTQDAEPTSLVPDNRLFALGGAGLACV